jgi:hypothetical protein
MTKREFDKLTKRNARYHTAYGYKPHPRSERSTRYKEGRGKNLTARDLLSERRPGSAKRRTDQMRQFTSRADFGEHVRRILGK